MALLARLCETRAHVIGSRCSLKIFQVATDAGSVGRGQIVVAIHVTLRALHIDVGAGERETCGRVVKVRARPGRGVVTLLTGLREARGYMVRIGRALEILQVATDAGRIGRSQVVVAIHVALRALHTDVGTDERETRSGVVKSRAGPGRGGVTLLAGLRESRLHMVRIGRALEILQVATDARCVRTGERVIAVYVALDALHAGVCAGQREPG